MKKVKIMEKLDHTASVRGYQVKRKIKDSFFKDSNQLARQRATHPTELEMIKGEQDDCVVTSIMCAANTTYQKAHTYCQERFNRQNGQGIPLFPTLDEAIGTKINDYALKVAGFNSRKCRYYASKYGAYMNGDKEWTLQQFVENHQVGRYILIVYGHAVAVIDGVLHGNLSDQYYKPSRKVYCILKMEQ